MSVIQKIRNKYIGLVIGFIVVALVGFLVMDAMQSNVSSMFSGDNTLMGEVNGQRIDYKAYDALKSQYETNLKSRNKEGVLSEQDRNTAQTQAWDDMVNDIIMGDEMKKLGIDITEKELLDIEMGPYPDAMVKQNFADPNTGAFDPSKVSQFVNSLNQDKTGQSREQWKDFEKVVMRTRKMNKYNDLITKGIYVPKFMVEQAEKMNSAKSSISYVQVPYTVISDSSVKVTDEDVKNYIAKNEKTFKANESFANVEYVAFDIIPSREDSALSLGLLNSLHDSLVNTSGANLESLVANNSEEAFTEKYYTEKDLEMPNPAEVLAASVGTVIGPVFEKGIYKMVKVLDKKSLADSAKASHILIKLSETRNDDQAKTMIDSLEKAVKGGASLAALATALSEDPGSAAKAGDLGYFGRGQMVPEFNDACFNGKVGDLTVVKSQFGYHLIKVTDQKAFKPAAKLAIMSKALVAGDATTQAASSKANEFISKAKDAATFTATAKAMGKDKRVSEFITPTATSVGGLGNARELARWTIDAKIGAVSQIFSLEDKYVVANLTLRQEKGSLMSVAAVRPQVEGAIRNEKKAKQIAEQHKGKTTLEAIATAANSTVKMADSISYQSGSSNPEIGGEPRLVGAAFSKGLVNKMSPAIQGGQGVYFIKVNNLIEGVVPKEMPMLNMMKQQMSMQITQSAAQMIPYILKQKSKLVDNRGKFL